MTTPNTAEHIPLADYIVLLGDPYARAGLREQSYVESRDAAYDRR